MRRTRNNFKGKFENITCLICEISPESYEHIMKNFAKRSKVDDIYRDDYECLSKFTREIMKFIRQGIYCNNLANWVTEIFAVDMTSMMVGC